MEINTIKTKKPGALSSIISHSRWYYPTNSVPYTQCRRNQDHLSPITWKISTVFLFLHQKITIFEHWNKFPVSLPFLELPSNAFIAGDEDFTQVIPAGFLIPAAHRRRLAPPIKKGMQLHPRPHLYSIHILPAACPTVYLRIPVLHRSSSRCPS